MTERALLTAVWESLDPTFKTALLDALKATARSRKPDVVISRDKEGTPYMNRWHLLPRRAFPFNAYLHHFLRSDDDRALHDHPWPNVSIILEGEYLEHIPMDPREPAGEQIAIHRKAGELAFREASSCHRIELFPNHSGFCLTSGEVPELMPVWTLFLTGKVEREWGFWCKSGWKHWKDFTGQDDSHGYVKDARQLGRGCGED